MKPRSAGYIHVGPLMSDSLSDYKRTERSLVDCNVSYIFEKAFMPVFTDAERAYLTEMRAITTNTKNEEVLVGLSLEETVFYMAYAKQRETHRPNEKDRDRYLELNDKHERERHAVLAAENQLRNDNPQRH